MLELRLRRAGPEIPLDVALSCAQGELLALVGPSGSGKTSVLRAIAGLLPVESGRVVVAGQVWTDSATGLHRPPEARRVGMVFQHYALFPHLDAVDNVALGLPTRLSRALAREHAQSLLADMRLADLGHRRPHELSGGQRQRVALARALARATGDGEPGVLLLDEAFAAVDQPTRHALWDELMRLRERHPLPVVMVTHDLHEARLLADQLCIVDGGQALQCGAPERVLAGPRNARVAELVGLRDVFSARFEKAAPGEACLHWGTERLSTRDKNRIDEGTLVHWVVSGEFVHLHREPLVGPNVLRARVERLRRLGDSAHLLLHLPGPEARLHQTLSAREVAALRLEEGAQIWVHLDPRGLHVMPVKTGEPAP
ncbi:ABC transporter ATP-binding protein [Inhella gelatinilytica]|uniref:ABC transporter ATP-binding protein n=1 Tax=Inhella gelatinilytica TaxID=2795030 RepID=A0A931NCE3_9BURK|nr:ABC transporter ATP-binding protein [Inhella gelatinilytica]MBH9551912.1 ABC transporter ATP-binding protein [Inhella gelatinilytica]